MIQPTTLIVDGVITQANEAFISFMDMHAHEIVGASPARLFPGIGLDSVVLEAQRRRRAYTIERDMEIGTRHATLSVQITPVGEQHVAVMTVTDLAPLRSGYLALLRQASKTRADQLWIVDENYVITYASTNTTEQTIWGVTVGDSVLHVLAEEDRPRAIEELKAARAAPGKIINSTYNLRRRKRLVPIHTSGMFLHGVHNVGHYFIAARANQGGDGAVDRLREAYQAITDAELAATLGIKASAISRARKVGIPPAWAYGALQTMGISGDWIMTGRGNKVFSE